MKGDEVLVQFEKVKKKKKKKILPTMKASVAAKGITAQISPSFGSYTVSAVPMMKVPPTQVAAGKHTGKSVFSIHKV